MFEAELLCDTTKKAEVARMVLKNDYGLRILANASAF